MSKKKVKYRGKEKHDKIEGEKQEGGKRKETKE